MLNTNFYGKYLHKVKYIFFVMKYNFGNKVSNYAGCTFIKAAQKHLCDMLLH